jgi:hypothetical protein
MRPFKAFGGLLTTDDKFIKKYTGNEIIVCNPLTFLQDRKGDNDA